MILLVTIWFSAQPILERMKVTFVWRQIWAGAPFLLSSQTKSCKCFGLVSRFTLSGCHQITITIKKENVKASDKATKNHCQFSNPKGFGAWCIPTQLRVVSNCQLDSPDLHHYRLVVHICILANRVLNDVFSECNGADGVLNKISNTFKFSLPHNCSHLCRKS